MLANVHTKEAVHLGQDQLATLWKDQVIRLDLLQGDFFESLSQALLTWKRLSINEGLERDDKVPQLF